MVNINVYYYFLTEKAKCSDFSAYRILWQQRIPCKKDMIAFVCPPCKKQSAKTIKNRAIGK